MLKFAKKMFTAVAAAAVILSFAACSDSSDNDSDEVKTVTTTTQTGKFGDTDIEFVREGEDTEGTTTVNGETRKWKMAEDGTITLYDENGNVLYTFKLTEDGGIDSSSVADASGSKVEANVEAPKTEEVSPYAKLAEGI